MLPFMIVFTPNIFASENYRINNVNSCSPPLPFALIFKEKGTKQDEYKLIYFNFFLQEFNHTQAITLSCHVLNLIPSLLGLSRNTSAQRNDS